MTGFDENIVREYFELNGFFVRQLRKHVVQSRKRQFEEHHDLVVYNPHASEGAMRAGFQLFSSDMPNLRGAVVGIKSWNDSKFTPAISKSSAKVCDFLKKEVIAKTDSYFQCDSDGSDAGESDPYAGYSKLIVVPGFPSNDVHRAECTELFKAQGIDGVINFSTILEDLLRRVAVNHSYSKSETLQLLRVLKLYDMVREPQMTLFS
jgi:hypothetical protein